MRKCSLCQGLCTGLQTSSYCAVHDGLARPEYDCYAGLVFFVVNLIFAGWIKFSPNKAAPACVTVILALALIYLSVTHGRWAKHIFGRKHQVQPLPSFVAACDNCKHARNVQKA